MRAPQTTDPAAPGLGQASSTKAGLGITGWYMIYHQRLVMLFWDPFP